jgi:phosphoglycolate phosphatase-like HAD superfamily hydrolase
MRTGSSVGPSPGRTEQEIGRLLGAYPARLAEEVDQSAVYRVMPGVEALLPRLVEVGVLLGIVSGALEAAAHIKLGRALLNRFFSFGGCGSDSADRAELTRLAIERCGRLHGHALNPARVLVVGDTPRDVEAGRAAGAVTVGVATGQIHSACSSRRLAQTTCFRRWNHRFETSTASCRQVDESDLTVRARAPLKQLRAVSSYFTCSPRGP